MAGVLGWESARRQQTHHAGQAPAHQRRVLSPCIPVAPVLGCRDMIPEPSQSEARKDLATFRDYSEDVLRSDGTSFPGNLRQLVRFMRESPLFDRVFATALPPVQFDSWHHAMTSSRQLHWPDDLDQKLALQNRLICAIVDGHVNVMKFVFAVFYVRNGESALAKFLDQIFHPFAREYLKLAEKVTSELPAEKPPAAQPAASANPSMDIFISHSSADEKLAGALALLFQVGLGVDAKKIRCTSVNGYRLSAGAKVEETLKAEVHETRVLVGLLTPASIHSSYVLFELGARWGASRFMAPLLACGAAPSSLPGPTAGINALRADSDEQMHQFLRDIAKELGLPPPDPAVYTKHLKDVVHLASIKSLAPAATSPAGVTEQEQKILRILWDFEDGLTFADLATKAGISRQDADYYSHELERRGFVYIPIDSDAEYEASIKQEGRHYLKTNGLA